MNRRTFIGSVFSAGAAIALNTSRTFGQDSEPEWQSAVFAPNVVNALTVAFANVNESSLFTEPLLLLFVSYEFKNTDDATESFSVLKEEIRRNYEIFVDDPKKTKLQKRVVEASVGRIGDDRFSFTNSSPDYAGSTWSGVRVEHQALTVMSVGLASTQLDFVADFLDDYISSVDFESRSILPELADMPVGWEANIDVEDVTDKVRDSAPPKP